jgi:hydroxymethylglutaryl-CoA synthase
MSYGISDLAFHVPGPAVDLLDLIRHRTGQGADEARLQRALAYTGQQRIRIPDWYEDSVTMLAEATRRLLVRNPAVAPSDIRHYLSGTESAQDYAKPLAAWAQGLVEVRGERIGPRAATYEVKHACAGGTYALLGVLNALRAEGEAGLPAAGVVGMTDVASFLEGSTAELTRGAGAVALLLEKDPALLEIDSGLVGVWGENVDDFYRSRGQRHATVRGRYSVDCYMRALEGAYGDFKQRALDSGALSRPPGGHFLDNFDYLVLHAPFHSMPVKALEDLFIRVRGMTPAQARTEMARLRIRETVSSIQQTGNLYTGSLYLCLGDLLVEEDRRLGADLEGRRILLCSYGSGNTMVVFGARVVPGAGAVIRRMGLHAAVSDGALQISAADAAALMAMDRDDPVAHQARVAGRGTEIPEGSYFLQEIRGDGYREYATR